MSAQFSVVIPTLDGQEDLDACLRSLCEADNGRLREVIVVDDGSQIPIRVAGLPRAIEVRVLRNERTQGPDRARNIAAALAQAEFVALLDDDARVAHDWFDVASVMADRGTKAFTGRVLPFDGGILSQARQWRYDARYTGLATGHAVNFFAGGNSVIERELLLEVGGFPVMAAGGDNGIVSRLAAVGVRPTYVRELRILHRNGKGLGTAAERAWSSGRALPAANRFEVVRDCAYRLRTLGEAPARVAAVNGLLQILHSSGRLVSVSTATHEEMEHR